MTGIDPFQTSLLISPEEVSAWADYINLVANGEGLAQYKTLLQFGNKQGESLWTHITNMACTLAALQSIVWLDDIEARVLYTAITVHDINKMRQEQQSFTQLAQAHHIAEVIEKIGFDDFFPDWREYLVDIEALVRAHSGHHSVDGDGLIVKHQRYRLNPQRLEALRHLIRALDVIDLSHSLDEYEHKNAFLGHLNAYLNASGDPQQFTFFTHQIVEQRGLLTNVMHNALMEALTEAYRLIPLLLYPDGVAYLGEQGLDVQLTEADVTRLGERIGYHVQHIVAGDVAKLIEPTKDGYKIKLDAFDAGVHFKDLWCEIRNQVARRKFKAAEYDKKARAAALRDIDKQLSEQRKELIRRLNQPEPVVQAFEEQFRSAEMARAYYLFLSRYLPKLIPNPWQHIYALLELPEDRWSFYNCFHATSHRLYVLAGDITLSEDEVFDRLLADGEQLLGEQPGPDEKETPELWIEYIKRYVLINGYPLIDGGWNDHLAHYMQHQHRQCVYCSGPFETALWMSGDVRGGIKVQQFTYRRAGGSSQEPKKYICAVCRVQFLLEKLNYPQVRNENTIYLHLFPYSFYPMPFVNGLRATFNRIRNSDLPVQALHLDSGPAVTALVSQSVVSPSFRAATKAGKSHPYGVYVPLYSETVSGAIILPINAPGANDTERFLFASDLPTHSPLMRKRGANDTERFLFAFWYALVLQRHFGVKVLMSESPVPPLDIQAIPDLYLDNVPLGCSGLLPRNDYLIFDTPEGRRGPLQDLWQAIASLFALAQLTFKDTDTKPDLVRAMLDGPLGVFYVADRLVLKIDEKYRIGVGREAFPHLQTLALFVGGAWMSELSEHLEAIAQVAWQNGIRGRTLKRSSLLDPVDQVFEKLARFGGPFDREALIAATIEDIFSHLERIADEQYKPGRRKRQAIEEFVRRWYDGVLDQVYGSNIQRLLADEKLLRSAYLFYLQAQIPHRTDEEQDIQGDEE